MNGILDLLAGSLGGNMGQLASAIGADEGSTQKAVGAALPALLAALNRNTNSGAGAQGLASALQRDHDGSLLDNIGGFLGGAMGGSRSTDGTGILGHILGGQRQTVEQGVAKASGLDMGKVAKLLPLLAPLVMAAIGRRQRQANLDPTGLSGLLGQESQRARQAAPDGLLGHLTGFLDKDGDGSIQDDLMAQAGRAALGKLFGR